METAKLKRFATEARINLMEGVMRKLRVLGFDDNGNAVGREPELISGATLWRGEEYPEDFHAQWSELARQLRTHGVREVVEEAAYIWFNRMVAIRILAKNNLCEPILVQDETTGMPKLLTDARMGIVPDMDAQHHRRFEKLMDDDTKTTEQFNALITAWCKENPVISSCFGSLKDFVELLLPDNIIKPTGFLSLLNNTGFINDDDYRSAELIGWLYQFYISDRKDEVFAKKGKYDAEEIPAATQIFTPNWIVKYMVQNTILPQVDAPEGIIAEAKYLVKNPDAQSCRKVGLEDLKVADFACGSGHILNECFDLLFKLYREEGYSRRESIENIFTKNLTGIDIDLRAKQLATFALLLKACQRDESFADAHCMPRVLTVPGLTAILKTSKYEDEDGGHGKHINHVFFQDSVTHDVAVELENALTLIKDADSLGSIIKFNLSPSALRAISETAAYWQNKDATDRPEFVNDLLPAIDFIMALSDSYDAIVMNPPYMGSGRFDEALSLYVAGGKKGREKFEAHYPESKADLFSVFMDVCIDHLQDGGKYGMINMQSWMFLGSFEALRRKIIESQQIDSLLHLGPRTFDELSGEVVQNSAFVITKCMPEHSGIYDRLIDGRNCNAKREMFLTERNRHIAQQILFKEIPDNPIAYWVSMKMLQILRDNSSLGELSQPRAGLQTSDNPRFLRIWHEVSLKKIGLGLSREDALTSLFKYFPHNKGGQSRRWYGNFDMVINFQNDGEELKYWLEHNPNDPTTKSWSRNLRNYPLYFKEGITWSAVTSGKISVRYSPKGCLFDTSGPMLFCDSKERLFYLLALTNSSIFDKYINIFAQGLSKGSGHFANVPVKEVDSILLEKIINIVRSNISISKQDWDAHETSWDFHENELVAAKRLCGQNCADLDALDENDRVGLEGIPNNGNMLSDCVKAYMNKWERLFRRLHRNEEELNRQFIEIYGLQDELTPEVPLNEVTILQQGEISIVPEQRGMVVIGNNQIATTIPEHIEFNLEVLMKQLISYIVGVWMGRYRLDKPGIHIAHPNPTEEELAEYGIPGGKLKIDSDAIIPILPTDAPFFDNLYNYIKDFIRLVFGGDSQTENLNFIEKCLSKSLDKYLQKDFWKDHKKMYQNKPIYWLFSSPKGAFQAIVYAHRMDRYTVEVMRSKYLLPYRNFVEKKIAALDVRAAELSTAERKELDRLRKDIVELDEYARQVEVVAGESARRDPVFDLDDGIVRNHALFDSIATKLK